MMQFCPALLQNSSGGIRMQGMVSGAMVPQLPLDQETGAHRNTCIGTYYKFVAPSNRQKLGSRLILCLF